MVFVLAAVALVPTARLPAKTNQGKTKFKTSARHQQDIKTYRIKETSRKHQHDINRTSTRHQQDIRTILKYQSIKKIKEMSRSINRT